MPKHLCRSIPYSANQTSLPQLWPPGLHSAAFAPHMHWVPPDIAFFVLPPPVLQRGGHRSSTRLPWQQQRQHLTSNQPPAHGRRTYTHTPQQQQDSRHTTAVQLLQGCKKENRRLRCRGTSPQARGLLPSPSCCVNTGGRLRQAERCTQHKATSIPPTSLGRKIAPQTGALSHTWPALYCAEPCSSATPYSPRPTDGSAAQRATPATASS